MQGIFENVFRKKRCLYFYLEWYHFWCLSVHITFSNVILKFFWKKKNLLDIILIVEYIIENRTRRSSERSTRWSTIGWERIHYHYWTITDSPITKHFYCILLLLTHFIIFFILFFPLLDFHLTFQYFQSDSLSPKYQFVSLD